MQLNVILKPGQAGDNARATVEPFVSIVTPFYNTDAYLAECIESVLAQSYTNWEYILINNCSTDRSLQIAEHYARGDARIRVVTNDQFLSQVQNYNCALTHISPDSVYCKLVEADNWIFPRCLAEMVKLAEEDSSIGLVGCYYLYGNDVQADGLPYAVRNMAGADACRTHLFGSIPLFGAPTNLLMRSSLVRRRVPFYSESSLHEDTEVCYDLLRESNFGFVHQVLAFLRTDNVSISTGLRPIDTFTLGKFVLFRKYGAALTAPRDYERERNRIEKLYFQDLIELLLTGQRKAVWALHKEALARTGYDLRWPALVPYVFWKLGDFLFNPKKAVGQILRQLRSRSQPPRHGAQ